jgi:hypothetical protein
MADGVDPLEQSIGLGGGAYTDNTPTHCVHASLATLTFQAIYTRA